MRARARNAAIVCLAILAADFFTLANRRVTTDPGAQALGRIIGAAAVVGLASSLVALMLGRSRVRAPKSVNPTLSPRAAAEPQTPAPALPSTPTSSGRASGPPTRASRLRAVKVAVALLVLAAWFIGMPVHAYNSRIAQGPGFVRGPWIADAFLSLFAVAMQLTLPTPVALAFWPSLAASVYLLLSRRDRPALDAIAGLVALGLTGGLAYVLLAGIEL